MKVGDLILTNDKDTDPNNLTDKIGLVVDSQGKYLKVLFVDGNVEEISKRYIDKYYEVVK